MYKVCYIGSQPSDVFNIAALYVGGLEANMHDMHIDTDHRRRTSSRPALSNIPIIESDIDTPPSKVPARRHSETHSDPLIGFNYQRAPRFERPKLN